MTQEEFEKLICQPKVFEKDSPKLPISGGNSRYTLLSTETDEKFFLDIYRKGTYEISKSKVQTRTNRVPLVRIEINAAPHINPDGRKISRNHVHIYKPGDPETDSLPWAYEFNEVPKLLLLNSKLDFMAVFYAMCNYCNINTSGIQEVL